MCLSIPGKIMSIDGDTGLVSVGGAEISVSLALLENPQKDDYVIVHAGIALQVISEEDAKEMLDLVRAYVG